MVRLNAMILYRFPSIPLLQILILQYPIFGHTIISRLSHPLNYT